MFNELIGNIRYAAELKQFLRHRLTPELSRQLIETSLRQREQTFLRILETAVYPFPTSPYRKLLDHADIALGDVEKMVQQLGLEPALTRLYEAGVYIALDEFKGRRPITRPGLEIPVRTHGFDHPLLTMHFFAQTSGSRGVPTRVGVALDQLAHEAAYLHHYLQAFDLADRPVASWRGVPPVASGIKLLLRYAKLGKPVERWFAQNRLPIRPSTLKYHLYTQRTLRRPKGRMAVPPS